MTPKQEIRRIAKDRIPSIVEERIILETLDGIADWSGQLVGKLMTLSDEEKEISRAWEAIYQALIDEVIKQLKNHANQRQK